jgi:TRAP-type C4-dicarboxylate transport system permease small subunit
MALEIPYGPFYWALALGMLLYAFVLIVELLLILQGRFRLLSLPPEDLST